MNEPAVTVLMAVYNGEKHLVEAIESIMAQDFHDFELLVIDDGSTDKTPEILASLKDGRIRVLTNEQNIGLTRSLNRGLKAARGLFIARMDADDKAQARRLAKQVDIMGNEGIGVTVSWAGQIDDLGQPIGRWDSLLEPEDIFYLLNFRNCITHSSVMFRRDLALDLGGYNEELLRAQDYEFWMRLSKKTRIVQIPEVLVYWRKTDDNISVRAKAGQDRSQYNLAKKNLERLAQMELTEKEVEALQFNRPLSEVNLGRTAHLLDRVNTGLMQQEASLLQPLGLTSSKVKRAMTRRKKDLLTAQLKNLSPGGRLGQAIRLPFRQKLFLAGQLFHYIRGNNSHESQ